MAQGFKFNLDGMETVLNNLSTYSNNVQQGVQEELSTTAYDIVTDAQQLAPVDLGNLQANIRVKQDGQYAKTITSGADYSAFVEFGTGGSVDIPVFAQGLDDIESYAAQFKGAGIRQTNMRAQPFFFPSVQKNILNMVDRLKSLIQQQP